MVQTKNYQYSIHCTQNIVDAVMSFFSLSQLSYLHSDILFAQN